MRRVLSVVLIIGLLALVSPAPAAAGGGTLGMTPSTIWSMLLSDADLESIRGGFFGMAFSIFFQGFFDNVGNTSGTVNFSAVAPVNTGGTTGPPAPVVGVGNEQVRLFAGVGNLNGVSGILQINQVPGSNNVVHN
ncbi:MAG: hypothetical protein ACRDGM_10190, partial [bacterium]